MKNNRYRVLASTNKPTQSQVPGFVDILNSWSSVELPLPVILNHNHDTYAGVVVDSEIKEDVLYLIIETELDLPIGQPVSIGANCLCNCDANTQECVCESCNLTELSLVTGLYRPCNEDAKIIDKIKESDNMIRIDNLTELEKSILLEHIEKHKNDIVEVKGKKMTIEQAVEEKRKIFDAELNDILKSVKIDEDEESEDKTDETEESSSEDTDKSEESVESEETDKSDTDETKESEDKSDDESESDEKSEEDVKEIKKTIEKEKIDMIDTNETVVEKATKKEMPIAKALLSGYNQSVSKAITAEMAAALTNSKIWNGVTKSNTTSACPIFTLVPLTNTWGRQVKCAAGACEFDVVKVPLEVYSCKFSICEDLLEDDAELLSRLTNSLRVAGVRGIDYAILNGSASADGLRGVLTDAYTSEVVTDKGNILADINEVLAKIDGDLQTEATILLSKTAFGDYRTAMLSNPGACCLYSEYNVVPTGALDGDTICAVYLPSYEVQMRRDFTFSNCTPCGDQHFYLTGSVRLAGKLTSPGTAAFKNRSPAVS